MAELSVSHEYAYPPDRVFDAWLDPKTASRFLFATPGGEMIQADIDARVGGRFTLVDRRRDQGDVSHEGEYLEIDRPRRLAFTFAVPKYDPAKTTVAVDFEPWGNGCRVTLTQTEVLPDWLEPSREGWAMILTELAEVLG